MTLPEISAQHLLDYANIKSLAAELHRPASTLFALAPANDPFSITDGRRAGCAMVCPPLEAACHRLRRSSAQASLRDHFAIEAGQNV